jgi:cathepsin B
MNSTSLEDFLKSRKVVIVRKKNAKGQFESGPNSFRVLPPMNANPTIKGIVPMISPERSGQFKLVRVPRNYNLIEDPKYKGKLTPILNQDHCGSCWAFAVATSLSDSLVVTGTLKNTPMISPTSILTQVAGDAGDGCQGGFPAKALIQLGDSDIQAYSEYCMDYSWCSNDGSCSGKGIDHLNAASDPAALNQLLPKPLCVSPDNNKYGFKVKKGSVSTSLSRFDIQAHIMKYGSVIGCYPVYESFTHYTKDTPNEAIYIPTIDPTTGAFVDSPGGLLGYHAVRIVGWGFSGNPIKYLPDKPAAYIPYWIVANSWDTTWGLDGFFKMAMYSIEPEADSQGNITVINDSSSFDNPSNQFGGIIMFEPDTPSSLNKTYYPAQPYYPEDDKDYYTKNITFFNSSDSVGGNKGIVNKNGGDNTETSGINKLYIIGPIVAIIFAFLIYNVMSKKKQLSFGMRRRY